MATSMLQYYVHGFADDTMENEEREMYMKTLKKVLSALGRNLLDVELKRLRSRIACWLLQTR